MYLVEMTDVGRNNAAETAQMEKITYNNLRRMTGGHLVSSDIGFHIDRDGIGSVFAGFRNVGKIKVTEL